jgi:NAD(P)-dependent dehydrogenase (short-subunit alcohol dehydrogenase family)
MDVRGKKAIVTGASSGIGRAAARMLAGEGVGTIVLVDLDREGLSALSAEIAAAGATPIARIADLGRPEDVVRVFEEADRDTGGLDIVHNNAGIMTGPPDFPDTSMDKMIAVIQINLIAMMIGTRLAVEQMRRRNAPGVIINTSSIAAFSTMPADPAYAASKHGILAFSRSCQPLHARFGIRVMAICPGIVDTAIVPKDAAWLAPALAAVKMLEPETVARAVLDIIADDTLAGDQVTISNEPPTAARGD